MEYESEAGSAKSGASGNAGAKLKVVQYLSTQLIVGKNLTLADISVEHYPSSRIEEMEDALLATLTKVRLLPLFVDPKQVLKEQKRAGEPETLVDYDKVGQLASQALGLYRNYLLEKNQPGSNIAAGELIDF